MIGMINLPTEGPVDYYAAPRAKFDELPARLQRVGRPTALANLSSLPELSSIDKPPPSPATREKFRASLSLFSQRQHRPSTGYCADGRRCTDGRPVNANNPSKLWDELFMRKMVNKVIADLMHSIQDEVASPVDHLQSIEKTFGRMRMLNRQSSRSEPNLCSEDLSTTARFCDACSAAIDEELSSNGKKERALSSIFSPRDDLIGDTGTAETSDSESVLDDIIAHLLTPPMSSAPGSTQNLCGDCS